MTFNGWYTINSTNQRTIQHEKNGARTCWKNYSIFIASFNSDPKLKVDLKRPRNRFNIVGVKIRKPEFSFRWMKTFRNNRCIIHHVILSKKNSEYNAKYDFVKVHSLDGDTDYFDIIADVLQGEKLAPYLFIIFLDYVLRTSIDLMKENGFKLTKERSRKYPAQIMTDTDYADDLALLANTTAQIETLLNSLDRASVGIGLHVNADKTEYMCFNQRGDISTLMSVPLKQVDKLTYFGSSVSSTAKDINTQLSEAWKAIDKLLVLWKSDLTDKIKCRFSKQLSCRFCYMDALHGR